MSYESYSSHEPARQEDFEFFVEIIKPWLLTRGVKEEGSEPLLRYPDGTPVYTVDNDGNFGNVVGFEYVAERDELLDIANQQPLYTLQVGSRISFSHTPAHYLYSPNTGNHQPTPEAFHVEITPHEAASIECVRYIITREDIDSPDFTGHRHVIAKPTASADANDQYLDQVSNPVNTLNRGLRAPTSEECRALTSIVHSLEY